MFRCIKSILKLKRYFKYVISSKKTYLPPRHSKVLVYNGSNSENLLKLLEPWNPEILYTEGEELNIIVLFKSFFTKGDFTNAYEDCYIRYVKPSIVITYIDNLFRFYLISNRHKNVKTIFVQNGWRGGLGDTVDSLNHDCSSDNKNRKVDVMCTFGDTMGEYYNKYIKGKHISIGSILNNNCPISNKEKQRRIAYVSNVKNEKHLNTEGTKYVLHELKHYSDIRNIPLVIVGRSNEESEKKYYRELVGEDVTFVDKNEKYDTYKYLDESEVSVTTGSSIGYETISRGNKNAFFSVFGYFNKADGHGFGWPAHYGDKGLFWVNYPDQKEFFRILDYLFEIDHEQWSKDIQMLNFSSLITYNPDNSIFKSVINKEIEC